METASFFKTLVSTYKSTWHFIPDNHHQQYMKQQGIHELAKPMKHNSINA
jgi:hypothetical protein